MFKVAMVDDNKEFLKRIKKITEDILNVSMPEYEICVYESPVDMDEDLESGKQGYFDLYLMDIEMPGMSGLELAQTIRKKYAQPYLIFVTAHVGYSVEGYKHKAFYYVLKDRLKEMLTEALNDIAKEVSERTEPFYILENAEIYQKLYYKDIYYIIVQKNYTYFHAEQGVYSVRLSLKKVYQELSDHKSFVFADQNCIVNLRHVLKLDRDKQMAVMRDHEEIWINDSRKKSFEQAILDYWRRH